jgi:Domain of unknown function (DUF4279)
MKTHFSASLFIKGDGLNLDEVSRTLGLAPTNISRKGERYGHAQTLCDFDGWYYSTKVGDTQSLDEHITALWDAGRGEFAIPPRAYLVEEHRRQTRPTSMTEIISPDYSTLIHLDSPPREHGWNPAIDRHNAP